MKRLPVSGPWITELEISYVTDAAAHAWYENANVFHQRFESAAAKYFGVQHAVALPSCTSAIHLALAALGIGPGDEVVVPDITWIGSSAPITYVGAVPVFADVDVTSWCLSAESFESVCTSRTKAVIAVDLYGNVPDMDAIRAIAKSRGIAVIEDAAEAVGATYKGQKAGALGDVGVLSFHGSKTLTTGEGGMLLTNDENLFRRVLVLRDHGRNPADKAFFNAEVAFKYKMSSLQAALGLAQLERVHELVERKRQIFDWYRDALSGVRGVTLNVEPPDSTSTYWMVTVLFDPSLQVTKDIAIAKLDSLGIDCRPFFHPLSSLRAYASYEQAAVAQEQNRVSYALSPYGVNLPSALTLEEADVIRVCDAVRSLTASA